MARKRTELELISRRISVDNGLMEIMLGGIMLLGAPMVEQPGIFTALFAMALIFTPRILEGLQERLVHPRIGYVRIPDEPPAERKRLVTGMLVTTSLIPLSAIAFAVIGGGEVFGFWMDYLLAPSFGLVCANGPLHLVREYGLRRAYTYAILFPVAGVAIPVTGIAHGYTSVAMTMLVVGVTAGTIGLISLRRFIRTHPVQGVADDVLSGT